MQTQSRVREYYYLRGFSVRGDLTAPRDSDTNNKRMLFLPRFTPPLLDGINKYFFISSFELEN